MGCVEVTRRVRVWGNLRGGYAWWYQTMGVRHLFRLQFTGVIPVSVQCEWGFDCFQMFSHTKNPLHAVQSFCASQS